MLIGWRRSSALILPGTIGQPYCFRIPTGRFCTRINCVPSDGSWRRLVATAMALRLYEHAHGRLPAALEALVRGLLPAVPLDPMRSGGVAVRYRSDDADPWFIQSARTASMTAAARGRFPMAGSTSPTI